MKPRVFILSPANPGGIRGNYLLREGAKSDIALKLQSGSATLCEVYTFISGLYFRGKAAYVGRFSAPPAGVPGAVVIVAGVGLVPLDAVIDIEQLRAISKIDIHHENHDYREPLLRAAAMLREHAGDCDYVLLGSIASEKYVQPLLNVFGDRLLFPEAFVGRGDMSRGGLMLRCARSSEELRYVPVRSAARHGARPPKLERLPRFQPTATQPEAIILIGLQGAGKTTYFEEHFHETHAHASRDVQKTAAAEDRVIGESLRARKSFAIDDTNATRKSRAEHIRKAKASRYRVIGIFFDTPARVAIGRNNHRIDKKPIPVPAILRAAKQLEKPELAEGFDEIRVVAEKATT